RRVLGGAQPLVQPSYAVGNAYTRIPAGRTFEGAGVGDVVALVSRPPFVEPQLRSRNVTALDELEHLEQTGSARRPASDVEGSAHCSSRPLRGDAECVDEILHEEEVTNLPSIAVDDDGISRHCAYEEMGHPPLILGPELTWAVDAAHPEDDGRHIIGAGIVEHVLIGGTLGAAVRAVEIQNLRFVHTEPANRWIERFVSISTPNEGEVLQRSVYLVCRSEDDERRIGAGSGSLEYGQCAACVHIEIADRIAEAGGNGHLRGEVKDGFRAAHR